MWMGVDLAPGIILRKWGQSSQGKSFILLASQALANALLYAGSNGIVYPSVRHSAGTCIACFRPALVFHPRRGQEYRITLGAETHEISFEQIIHPLLTAEDH